MTLRSTRQTVTFTRPFSLPGIAGLQPAGSYVVETDEELLEGLSFPVYRRVATTIFLPTQPGGTVSGQLVVIEAKKDEHAALRDRDGKERTAAEQAAGYVALLSTHREVYMPYFKRLASAMGRIYRSSPEELRVDDMRAPRWEVWWPNGRLPQP